MYSLYTERVCSYRVYIEEDRICLPESNAETLLFADYCPHQWGLSTKDGSANECLGALGPRQLGGGGACQLHGQVLSAIPCGSPEG